ncbi:hypothetical protein HCC61_03465 [Streptomyces sp. HNM0575]|uniref:hypothetical protein n=1 Tax=Streptomyces sp. HNM0575 TaxID=2716338 RepID=UPI00145CC9CD|nr:hypothetical protein [Streptomyces sp. HNM0575]NLU71751.1 hypothetical protein [Streptomyces sp. HNM0575]
MNAGQARRKRPARLLAAATATAALSSALSGCVTVHGETAVIPAVSKPDAEKVLKEFNTTSNRANSSLDPGLNSTIETGALGAIDQAGLKSRKKLSPKGNPGYEPLRLSDARFLIPRQAGWPKFFVANTRSNRTDDGRWLLVFQRDDADSDWRASYLAVIQDSEMPGFVIGGNGYAKAVRGGSGSRLVVPPDELSAAYVNYLKEGTGEFASGDQTSKRREQREGSANRPGKRTEFADVATGAPQYAPFGLRTKDGGALVFFTSQHHTKETYAEGYKPPVKDPLVKALMKGTPQQSVTYVRVSEQAVKVPAEKNGGEVEFLNRIDGLTSVKGE